MRMSLAEFAERIEKSKSYDVTEIYVSSVPARLYSNNSMNIPANAVRELYSDCAGRFASSKDEDDYYRLAELIERKKPVYPLSPVISAKDVAGLTLVSGNKRWTLNMSELRGFASEEIFGVIETPFIKINSKARNCIKGVFSYIERGGKAINIYRQSMGAQSIPAVSASYVTIIDNGKERKVRIKGTLTIPLLQVDPKYLKFAGEDYGR